jgi:hypothetical protein
MKDLNYIEMLSYMRPEGSKYQKKFCNRYLLPVFGQPDKFGNYTHIVGNSPRIAFMSHHDTVHVKSGRQLVKIDGDFARTTSSNCLGADCTTGIYVMLSMIEAGVEGVYVVHAAEELGCIGSRALVNSKPTWLDHVDVAISLDRKGYSSIITHQMGMRTCSEDFSNSLADILDLGMKSDDTGAYTDSNEYTHVIAECTNISVGYFNQHSSKESQDLVFVETLVDAMISADWSQIVVKRVAGDIEEKLYEDKWVDRYWEPANLWRDFSAKQIEDYDMTELVKKYPDAIVSILQDHGYTASDLLDDIQRETGLR